MTKNTGHKILLIISFSIHNVPVSPFFTFDVYCLMIFSVSEFTPEDT